MGHNFTYTDASKWYTNIDKLIKYTNEVSEPCEIGENSDAQRCQRHLLDSWMLCQGCQGILEESGCEERRLHALLQRRPLELERLLYESAKFQISNSARIGVPAGGCLKQQEGLGSQPARSLLVVEREHCHSTKVTSTEGGSSQSASRRGQWDITTNRH